MQKQVKEFFAEVRRNIRRAKKNARLQELSKAWMRESHHAKYDYNFTWLGRPIIQIPQDIIGLQQIIWKVKPDLIIETGIAHGGSLIFHASMLELIGGAGKVLGIDIDIRGHNRKEIESHPMYKRIEMIEGPSADKRTAKKVYDFAKDYKKVLVVLDSKHTHAHVLKELQLYSPLVRKGSYIIVFDTIIEDMPVNTFPDRPWGRGNSPKTAVYEFLRKNKRFEIDDEMNARLLLTVAPDGYLECVK